MILLSACLANSCGYLYHASTHVRPVQSGQVSAPYPYPERSGYVPNLMPFLAARQWRGRLDWLLIRRYPSLGLIAPGAVAVRMLRATCIAGETRYTSLANPRRSNKRMV